MHRRPVHKLGTLKSKTDNEAQGHDITGWVIKWKWGNYLTFTVVGYYNGFF